MKFDKYWDPRRRRMQSLIVAETSKDIEFNFALVIATFMDPRRKEDYFFYCKVSTNDRFQNMWMLL
jgi:hypothetical protein